MEHFAGYKMSALALTRNWTVRAGFEIFQSSRTREFFKASSPPQFQERPAVTGSCLHANRLEREHPAIVASPGGILWIDRARRLPQRRDRVCGAASKGEGPPGTGDGGRSPCERQRGRVDNSSG